MAAPARVQLHRPTPRPGVIGWPAAPHLDLRNTRFCDVEPRDLHPRQLELDELELADRAGRTAPAPWRTSTHSSRHRSMMPSAIAATPERSIENVALAPSRPRRWTPPRSRRATGRDPPAAQVRHHCRRRVRGRSCGRAPSRAVRTAGSTTTSSTRTPPCTGWGGRTASKHGRRRARSTGGVYGVAIGGLFAAESMFHRVTDAGEGRARRAGRAPARRRRGAPRRPVDDAALVVARRRRRPACQVPRAPGRRRHAPRPALVAVTAVVERYLDAIIGHDWDALAACLSDDGFAHVGPVG